jgi:tetratricopeptide (TPR) repeat protein
VIFLLALLLAAGPVHRARAERAEALGHMREAAREYEAAFSETREPELLYRLGIVRRKLKQYALAREAFRAYLRAAPEGGLREEVQRQLVKIDVLLEAQSENFPEEAPAAKRPGEQRSPASAQPAPAPAPPPASTAPLVVAPPPLEPPAVVTMAPPVVVPPAASPAALPGEQRSPAVSKEVNAVHHAGPWMAGGAAIAAATGAYFWWDGARLSNALDTRFAQGGLQPRDQPLYGKSNSASIAGRVLVAAGAALAVGAVVLW